MTQAPTPTDLDRRIRRAGKIGRFLCSTFLIGGTLLALLLLATAATHPEALVKLNLDSKHGAQVAGFRQAPAKLLALLLEKPEELIHVAAAQQEANKYQDLVDYPEKRGGFVAVTGLLATLILGFTWLLRQLFAAFAEGHAGDRIARDERFAGVGSENQAKGGFGRQRGVAVTDLISPKIIRERPIMPSLHYDIEFFSIGLSQPIDTRVEQTEASRARVLGQGRTGEHRDRRQADGE